MDGIDLAGPIDDATISEIRAALTRHRVLFFQEQEISADEQVAFASRFGPLTLAHPNSPSAAGGDTRVLELTSARANHWHSDVSFVDHPPLASLLVHVHEAILLAGRVAVLVDGSVALDLAVSLPRPRGSADPGFQALRTRLLAELGVVVPQAGLPSANAACDGTVPDNARRSRPSTCENGRSGR